MKNDGAIKSMRAKKLRKNFAKKIINMEIVKNCAFLTKRLTRVERNSVEITIY